MFGQENAVIVNPEERDRKFQEEIWEKLPLTSEQRALIVLENDIKSFNKRKLKKVKKGEK